jgi:hypothetical protein
MPLFDDAVRGNRDQSVATIFELTLIADFVRARSWVGDLSFPDFISGYQRIEADARGSLRLENGGREEDAAGWSQLC